MTCGVTIGIFSGEILLYWAAAWFGTTLCFFCCNTFGGSLALCLLFLNCKCFLECVWVLAHFFALNTWAYILMSSLSLKCQFLRRQVCEIRSKSAITSEPSLCLKNLSEKAGYYTVTCRGGSSGDSYPVWWRRNILGWTPLNVVSQLKHCSTEITAVVLECS